MKPGSRFSEGGGKHAVVGPGALGFVPMIGVTGIVGGTTVVSMHYIRITRSSPLLMQEK